MPGRSCTGQGICSQDDLEEVSIGRMAIAITYTDTPASTQDELTIPLEMSVIPTPKAGIPCQMSCNVSPYVSTVDLENCPKAHLEGSFRLTDPQISAHAR